VPDTVDTNVLKFSVFNLKARFTALKYLSIGVCATQLKMTLGQLFPSSEFKLDA
jgi:hypothetical protein